MFLLSTFTDLVFYGYGLSTPVLGGLYLVRPQWRPALRRWLAVSAGLLLAAATTLLLRTLATGLAAGFSHDEYEAYAWLNRISGPYWLAYWGMLAGQGLLPQVLWWRALRQQPGVLVLLVPGVLASSAEYWMMRYYASQRDYLPSSWEMGTPYAPGLLALLAVYLVLLLGVDKLVRRFRA